MASIILSIPMAQPIINEDEIVAVEAVLRSGHITQGQKVEEFEEAFANYIGTRFAVAVSSGTSALHIALLSHGVGPGDEVITTPFTFIATANAILFTGAKPVFADIDLETYNLDPNQVLDKITSRTRAIIPVHLFGHPCDMKALTDIAEQHDIVIIEDACQAHGAEYDGRKVGSIGTGCFSFYPTKNMTTGEGGMITTNDIEVAGKAVLLRNHGQKSRYYHTVLGYNHRMTDIEAAIGACQLQKLVQFNLARTQNAEFLSSNLIKIGGLIIPGIKPYAKHAFHQYTLRVSQDFGISRDELRKRLKDKGVSSEIYYPLPINRQPLYQDLGYDDHLPVSEKAALEVISLPVHPSLTEHQLGYIAECVRSCRET